MGACVQEHLAWRSLRECTLGEKVWVCASSVIFSGRIASPEYRKRRRANLTNRTTDMIATASNPRRKSLTLGGCANHNKSIRFIDHLLTKTMAIASPG